MKKTLFIPIAALLIIACSGQRYASSEPKARQDTLTYSAYQAQALTQKDVQFFSRVCEDYGGLQFTPMWLTTSENEEGTFYAYYCKGQNGKNVMVTIQKPQHGKPIISEIKQMPKPNRPSDVVTVFYDASVGSGPLDAVLGTQNCEVLQRDENMCSVTLRIKNSDTRTLIENTKGVLSVAEHQMMPQ